MERLARYAPRNFIFSAKIVKTITHKKLLNPKLGVEKDLETFLSAVKPLKYVGKLGALLVQMPPRGRKDIPYFEDFLALLPSEYKFAVEFRDESWLQEDIFKLLEKYGVAYTIVDEPLLPPITRVTCNFSYIRWHGRGQRPWYYYHYTLDELKKWVPRIQEIVEKANTVYGYFNNHFRGYAPHNALQMLQLLGIINRKQREALRKLDEYFTRGERERTRERVLRAVASGGIEEVLQAFAGKKRFERAQEIPDTEVRIVKQTPTKIEAQVKNYRVVIDLEEKILAHDCADWEKIHEGKRLCKHIAKLFLKLPPRVSSKLLEDIALNLEEWSFEPLK